MATAPKDDLTIAQQIDSACDRFEEAFHAGQRPQLETFLSDASDSNRLQYFRGLLELELELRRDAGELPQRADYTPRFPDYAAVIELVFADVAAGNSRRSTSRTSAQSSSVKSSAAETSRGPDALQTNVSVSLPQEVGRFQIQQLLGEGAFGAVYRARDPQLDREVAVKVPQSGSLSTKEERDRFLREARAAAGLHHPNICPVHEVGTTPDGRDYIVMAFIEGKTLSKVLQTGQTLSGRQIAGAIRKLAVALEEAHEKGVIHRDLKPANIMINRKGEPVIMDFGLARRSSANDVQLSYSGQIMGTPAYMSPEQARGDSRALGPATDIYSLGVVMYEMLCGKRPFSGTVTEVLGQILHVDAPPPSKFRPEVDSRLEEICLKAIAKEPKDRFASMKDLAAALADYVKSGTAAIPTTSATAAEPPAADEPLHTQQLARLVAAVSTDVEEKVERAARRVVRQVKKSKGPKPPPFWAYLAGSGLIGVIVLLGIIFLVRGSTITNLVIIEEDVTDPSLTFFLDSEPLDAQKLAVPIELTAGIHILDIHKDGKFFKQYKVTAIRGRDQAGVDVAKLAEPPTAVSATVPPKAVAPFNADQAKQFQDAWAKHLNLPVELTNSLGMKFRLIPPGEFVKGSPESEPGRWPNESPQQPVTIPEAFFLGTHEVTQAEFEKIMGTNPSHFVGPDSPVGWVQWTEAREFCRRLSELPAERTAGRAYRLPYEYEWEFACRAGTSTAFSFGDSLSVEQSNFNGYGTNGQKLPGTAPGQTVAVGSYAPNAWNLFDMHGNVPEWCENLGDDRPNRIIRGGGWNKDAGRCRSAYRAGDFHYAYTPRVDLVGFRVVMVSHVGALPDVDRAAAEWATTAGVGGAATLVSAGREQTVQPGEPLPTEAFSIVALNLSTGDRAGNTVLGRLSQLRELRHLDLRGQPITDAGLHHLYSLKNLRTVNLSETNVTPAGLQALQEALPRCAIISSIDSKKDPPPLSALSLVIGPGKWTPLLVGANPLSAWNVDPEYSAGRVEASPQRLRFLKPVSLLIPLSAENYILRARLKPTNGGIVVLQGNGAKDEGTNRVHADPDGQVYLSKNSSAGTDFQLLGKARTTFDEEGFADVALAFYNRKTQVYAGDRLLIESEDQQFRGSRTLVSHFSLEEGSTGGSEIRDLQAFILDGTTFTPDEAMKLLPASGAASETGFVPLFNGDSLAGWQGQMNLWSLRDGVLTGQANTGQSNTFLFSPRPYADFELRFQTRIGNADNSGVQIRSEVRDAQKWSASGPQADIGNRTGDFWGGVYAEGMPGGWMLKPASSPPVKSGDWNEYFIRCVGKRVTIQVNGVTTVDGEIESMQSTGLLAFQIHRSSQKSVEFRQIEIRELGNQQAGFVPLFNGNDLTGWKVVGPAQWTARNGAVFVDGSQPGHLVCDQQFGDFELTGEVYAEAKGNGGISFRATGTPSDRNLPRGGYEFQVAGSQGDPGGNFTGGLYADSTKISTVRPAIAGDRVWANIRIRVEGTHLQGWVNDQPTFDVRGLPDRMRGGQLTLKAQPLGGEVGYRNFKIRPLASVAVIRPPDDARTFNGHAYKFFPEQLSWKEAKARCEALGGHLVIIETPAENAFVTQLIADGGKIDSWIGATDEETEGQWRWVDGRPLTWTNWFNPAKQPNNKGGIEHFTLVSSHKRPAPPEIGWEWSDQPNVALPAHQPGFVCEWEFL